jgi:nitrite reductase/ring-hydroxylating ferredoxin subunit/uncharacterized membrane protein
MSTGTGASAAGTSLSRLVDQIGAASKLDAVAGPLSERVAEVLGHQPLKDILSGTWLGHPLHPLLTDLPIGFWTSAFTLDLLGGRRSRRAATQLVAWGVLTAIPTAVTGASDWSDTVAAERRIGLVHAAANTTALICYGASWVQRVRGRHWRGVALGLAGATAATVGGYLGGHLLQHLGVGIDRAAFRAPPPEWTRVTTASEVDETPRCFLAGDAPVIVFRHRGSVIALDAECPHRGAPLAEGTVDGDVLVCPWHGSRFHLPDGALVQGPSVSALPAYECRTVDGVVEVRSAG